MIKVEDIKEYYEKAKVVFDFDDYYNVSISTIAQFQGKNYPFELSKNSLKIASLYNEEICIHLNKGYDIQDFIENPKLFLREIDEAERGFEEEEKIRRIVREVLKELED